VALVVLGGSVAAAGGGGSAYAGGGLRTAQIGGVNVLVNAKGFTLYWFALDTPPSPPATAPAPTTGSR
jgi:predicted lipoprotein with Yx(FWY)xxD motif